MAKAAPKIVPDPAGIFASDDHRRVLGHLSHPDDEYGWTVDALLFRMEEKLDFARILGGLESDGHAACYDGSWRMTQAGFDALTGPIANEPPDPGAAMIETHVSRAGAATRIEVTT
jgi:hypothetical protein